MVHAQGWGAQLAKCDISLPFTHFRDFKLLGFCFKGHFYMDIALPMGCSVSCAALEAFSSFLEWALCQKVSFGGILHYLDDLLFVEAEGTGHCRYLMRAFMGLAKELGEEGGCGLHGSCTGISRAGDSDDRPMAFKGICFLCSAHLQVVRLVLTVVFFIGAGVRWERKRILVCRHSYVFWAAHQAKRAFLGTQLQLSEWTTVEGLGH